MGFIKQVLISVFFSFLFIATHGRDIKITGQVVDNETNEAVPFATVAFYESGNSQPLDGTTTDIDGNFFLQINPTGDHHLVFSFIGYSSIEVPLDISPGMDELPVGRVRMAPLAVELQEVEVAAMARTAVNRMDRVSYRAEDFETARGGTAADLLSRLPALSVSPEGEVSVRGTTDFVVYLNGRPTQIEPDVLLAQLSAASITGIDIITVPSAAYDAQGKGGIINITTSREEQQGLSVNIDSRLGGSPWGNRIDGLTEDRLNDDRYGGGFSLIYSERNYAVYGGLSYDYRNLHGSRTGTGRILDPNTGNYKIMDAGGLKPEWHENISANLGFERSINDRSDIAASYYFGSRLEGRTANYLYNNYFTDNPALNASGPRWDENFTLNPNTGLRKGFFNTVNLDYNTQTPSGSNWSLGGLYEYTTLNHDIDNPNIAYDPDRDALTGHVSHYMQKDKTPLHGFRLTADYNKLLDNGLTFSMGVQPQYLVIAGDFGYDTLNVAANQWGSYQSLENSSALRRGILAAYVDGSGQWNGLQYKVGLRAEHTDQSLEIDNPDYFNLFERPVQDRYLVQQTDLFPSLHASYRLGDHDVLSLAASRRISRSPVKNMFPFLYRRHLEVYVVGDPALKPEYIQTAELSYKKNFNNQQVNLTGFYRDVTNAVFRVNTVFPDELVLIRSFTNAGKTTAAGGELSANLEWGTRAKLFLGASVYHFHVDADIFGYREDHQSVNWNLKGSGNIMLGTQFRLSADFDIRSAEVTAQGRNELFYMTNAALSFTPSNFRAWTFNLRVLNILDSNNRVLSTRAYDATGVQIFYQDTDFYYYGPIAELMISYSINRSSRSTPKDREGFGRDEF